MAEQWIIRVQGKDYGPADLETLQEWKAHGRVIPPTPARRVEIDIWNAAAEIPGLFRIDPPPVQRHVKANASPVRPVSREDFAAEAVAAGASRRPTRNVFVETFRIYFRGFFQ